MRIQVIKDNLGTWLKFTGMKNRVELIMMVSVELIMMVSVEYYNVVGW